MLEQEMTDLRAERDALVEQAAAEETATKSLEERYEETARSAEELRAKLAELGQLAEASRKETGLREALSMLEQEVSVLSLVCSNAADIAQAVDKSLDALLSPLCVVEDSLLAASTCVDELRRRMSCAHEANRRASESSAGFLSSLSVAVETSERAVEGLELSLADFVTRQQHLASQSKSRSLQLDSSICSVGATVEDIEGILALSKAAWRHVQESLSHKLRMLLKEAKTCERIAGDAGDPTVYNGLVRTIDELTRTKKMVEEELKVRNSELNKLKRHVEKLKESDRASAAPPPAEANQEWQTLQLKLTKVEQENQELSRLLVDFDSEQLAMRDHLEQQSNTFKSFLLCLLDFLSPVSSCTREDMQEKLVDLLKFIDFAEGSDSTSAEALQGSVLALAALRPASVDQDKPWQVVGELVSVSSAFKPPKELMTPPTPKSDRDESRRSSTRPLQILSPPPSSPDHLDSPTEDSPGQTWHTALAAADKDPYWNESHVFLPDRVTRDLHVALLSEHHDMLGHVSVSLWDAGLQVSSSLASRIS
ncbi:hypothetical protein GUITHDRAFT_114104 [Guillardia theta CCMP2712]|uniref:C2 domain-containing protein n=1 Tax=Guillardia theta (strain CCMP2712) TaxID=905079 RepID=L1IVF0_GUITC|nr:hypothetical protein GUITHDRAFT_114104 [Guillardia theta CCMP2712]EKX39854.1 hypothetical protein GUITHDRAFT_114104 [Guillardia theta CCMP2712]|eukprot:XP_005826834.1 hypothetical protein GUITHDRAFT_114104 [Guillardia theta CCMP2712]